MSSFESAPGQSQDFEDLIEAVQQYRTLWHERSPWTAQDYWIVVQEDFLANRGFSEQELAAMRLEAEEVSEIRRELDVISGGING